MEFITIPIAFKRGYLTLEVESFLMKSTTRIEALFSTGEIPFHVYLRLTDILPALKDIGILNRTEFESARKNIMEERASKNAATRNQRG